MPLSILTNVASLRAQRQLSRTSEELARTYERLASGQRINHASDDAAGLIVSTTLRRESRLTSVAIRNANDGLSLLSIGDAALGEISNILSRMAELAEQSANGVYSNLQRSPIQAEFAALGSEVERIATTTVFNGINILSGMANVVLQVGNTGQASSRITIQGIQGTLQSITLANPGSSALSYSVNGATASEAQAASRTALDAVFAAIQEVGNRRGSLGAVESRLSSTIANLTTARENIEAAASRIEDADIAQEAARLVRLQILQQAGAAVLAQANIQPEIALRLLTDK